LLLLFQTFASLNTWFCYVEPRRGLWNEVPVPDTTVPVTPVKKEQAILNLLI